MKTWKIQRIVALLVVIGVAVLVNACGKENPLAPESDSEVLGEDAKSLDIERQTGDTPPAGQVSVMLGGETLVFWPYTGATLDGTPMDPINVVFAGEADPLQVRAALLALDGDRTAYGFPSLAPFDAVWEDAIGGDVQTTYADGGDGWIGSVVQLTLGGFGPLRCHLRLFRSGVAFGDGCWTLGGAHFELQIPGTADHQVLSWELAEQLVIVDMLRCGLLDASLPMTTTGAINAAPSFREIPVEIYNGLPTELTSLIGGPPTPVAAPVPLASDGHGTLFNVADAAEIAVGRYQKTVTVAYDQYVPRPYCSTGPTDWLQVSGPVEFTVATEIDAYGCFYSESHYAGTLDVQPVDMSSGLPVPFGEAFNARVGGRQQGFMSTDGSRILAVDRRLTREADGPQILCERLSIPEHGLKVYRGFTRCIDLD